MSQRDTVDVLVIGAGPAGSLAAAQLARSGHQVLVLEKQRFPRFSIGESLLANSLQFIEDAGMLDAVLACGFQFKNGAAFARGERRSEFNFVDKVTTGPAYTFQVPRADFDHALAQQAERMGAKLRYEVEITAVDFSGERPLVRSRSAQGEHEEHRPRFVLDASGFGRTLSRLLSLERPSAFPVRAALFTHIEDQIPAGAFDRQKIRISIHPLEREVWYWLIPFSNGRSSLGVVAGRELLARYQGTAEQRLWQLVREEISLSALLAEAEPVAQAGEIIGYAASVTELHGRHFALLGNAAEFLDPVFSSGVTIAMQSAKLACEAVRRQLQGESVDWNASFSEPLMYGVETFRAFVGAWYNGDLQDIIFFERADPLTRRRICSVLAGYAWDVANPYTGPRTAQRLRALAELCRQG